MTTTTAAEEEMEDYNKPLPIDISLLSGLEVAMSKEEQMKITQLMTSGDPEQVAMAAAIKQGMGELVKEGVTPSGRHAGHTASMKKLLETSYTNDVAVHKALLKDNQELVQKIRLSEQEVKEKKRLHPLPSRMPLYGWIDPFDAEGANKGGLMGLVGVPQVGGPIGKGPLGRRNPPSLTFVDDEWDGSLSDAFATLSVEKNGTVQHKTNDSPGIAHIIKAAGDKPGSLAPPSQPRVLIREVHMDASKKGFRKGDVVTHINGKAFTGNSEDLIRRLTEIKEAGQEKFQIVVNAELCVAEALRLRSIC